MAVQCFNHNESLLLFSLFLSVRVLLLVASSVKMVAFTPRISKDKLLSHPIYKLQRHGFMCVHLLFSKDVAVFMDVEWNPGPTLPVHCRDFFLNGKLWNSSNCVSSMDSIQYNTILRVQGISPLIAILTHFMYFFIHSFNEVSVATTKLHHFISPSYSVLLKILHPLASKSCEHDPVLSSILLDYLDLLGSVIWKIVNLSLETSIMPTEQNVICPLLKKPGLDHQHYRNFRPISNLIFLSKVIGFCIGLPSIFIVYISIEWYCTISWLVWSFLCQWYPVIFVLWNVICWGFVNLPLKTVLGILTYGC